MGETTDQFNVRQISERIPLETPTAEEATIVIFGASGDLTARKLIPALFHLWIEGYLSEQAPIVGVARREKTDESFRNEMFGAVQKQARNNSVTAEQWNQFAERLFYRQLDLSNAADFSRLEANLNELEQALTEIERVGKGNKKHVAVESYRNESEKANLLYWQLTCRSFYTPEEWEWFMDRCGYHGDYSYIVFE